MAKIISILEGYNREVTIRGFVDRLYDHMYDDESVFDIDTIYELVWTKTRAFLLSRQISGSGPFKDQIWSHPELKEYVFNTVLHYIESTDPTPDRRLSRWAIQKYASGGIKRLEDIPRAFQSLWSHDSLKRSGYFKRQTTPPQFMKFSDIFAFKSLGELDTFLMGLEKKEYESNSAAKDKEEARLLDENQAVVLLNNDDVKITVPMTKEASCYFGKNTKWCTASTNDNMFDSYNTRGKLYILLLKKTNERYQFQYETQQFMDEADNPVRIQELDSFPEVVWTVLDKSLIYLATNYTSITKFTTISPAAAKILIDQIVQNIIHRQKATTALTYFAKNLSSGLQVTPEKSAFEYFKSLCFDFKHANYVAKDMIELLIQFPEFNKNRSEHFSDVMKFAGRFRLVDGIAKTLVDHFDLIDDFKEVIGLISVGVQSLAENGTDNKELSQTLSDIAMLDAWGGVTIDQWKVLIPEFPWVYQACKLHDDALAIEAVGRDAKNMRIAANLISKDALHKLFDSGLMDSVALSEFMTNYNGEITKDDFYGFVVRMDSQVQFSSLPDNIKKNPEYQIAYLEAISDSKQNLDLDSSLYRVIDDLADVTFVVALCLFGGNAMRLVYLKYENVQDKNPAWLGRIIGTALKRQGKDNYGILQTLFTLIPREAVSAFFDHAPDNMWEELLEREPICVKVIPDPPREVQLIILKKHPRFIKFLRRIDADIAEAILKGAKSETLRMIIGMKTNKS